MAWGKQLSALQDFHPDPDGTEKADKVAQNRSRGGPGNAGLKPEQVFLIGVDVLPDHLHPVGGTLRNVAFSALNSAMLYVLRPDHVICPLFGPEVDAAQLIVRLHHIGYGGRMTVLATVPDPAMVAAELCELAPAITVTVVVP